MDRLRRVTMALVALGLVSGLMAIAYWQNWVSSQRAAFGTWENVVVAAQQLKAGAVLRSTDLSTISIPKRFHPVGAVDKAQQVVGKRLLAPMQPGAYVRATDVDGTESIAPDMRALTIEQSDRIHIGSAEPGGFVDVYGAWGTDQKLNTGAIALRLKVISIAQGQHGTAITAAVPITQLSSVLLQLDSDRQVWVFAVPPGGEAHGGS